MKTQYLVLLFIFSLGTACSSEICRPGHLDSPYIQIGKPAPQMSVVQNQFVGMSLPDANKLLGPHFTIDQNVKSNASVAWVFEDRQILTERSCATADVVRHGQRFLLVKAQVVEGVVRSCVISSKVFIGKELVTPEAAISREVPLSVELATCAAITGSGSL